MTARWAEIVASSSDKKVDLNVLAWLSRSTLDAIGEGMSRFSRMLDSNYSSLRLRAAFDIRFNAIEDDSHILVRSYSNLVFVSSPSIRNDRNPTHLQERYVRTPIAWANFLSGSHSASSHQGTRVVVRVWLNPKDSTHTSHDQGRNRGDRGAG
jgi:hypothetical protein